MNFILQLFKYFGALAAFVLCIGFVSKTDLTSLLEKQVSQEFEETDLEPTQEYATMSFSRAKENYSDVNDRRTPKSGFSDRAALPVFREKPNSREVTTVATKAPSSARRVSSSRNSINQRDINSWVEMSAAQTFLEAEKETMSPGVILATGIYFLQQGQGDLSMNAADVAAYLAEVRDNASADAKKHMKYIANSEEWFKGLSLAGFDGNRIADIFDQLELAAYDKAMYSRHVERKIEQDDYTADASALGADETTRKRNLADAYNEYADRPEVRKKYGLPSAKAPAAISSSEVSEGREEAQSFRKGESRIYDNPRLFWSVLQEMIALEHDYDSWDSYQSDYPSAANKEFQNRSDIMALGGEMKVNRKR